MGEMYDLLKEGLTEVLEHAQGKRTLRTKKVVLPAPPKQYRAKDIKAFEETDKGEGLITCKDVGDLFDRLGLNE